MKSYDTCHTWSQFSLKVAYALIFALLYVLPFGKQSHIVYNINIQFQWTDCLNHYMFERQAHEYILIHIGGLVQERRNSIANALELRLSCTNPSTYVSDA